MVPGQILAAVLALEILHADFQDTIIEVLSALDLENAVLAGQQRDAKGAATKLHGGAIPNDGIAQQSGSRLSFPGLSPLPRPTAAPAIGGPATWAPPLEVAEVEVFFDSPAKTADVRREGEALPIAGLTRDRPASTPSWPWRSTARHSRARC